MKYKGLILDLDNTLLRGNPSAISAEDLRAIKDSNIPVIVATGRTYERAKYIYDLLELDTPMVLLQGAMIVDGDCKKVFPIKRNTIDLIIKWTEEYNLDYTIVYEDGIDYKGRVLMDYIELPKNPVDKSDALQVVICIDDENVMNKFVKYVQYNKLECSLYLYKNYIICISSEADKGLACSIICDNNDWDICEFVAMGNYPSDLALFDEVGKAIVVKSNSRTIPEEYDVLDPDGRDVVKKVIYKYI